MSVLRKFTLKDIKLNRKRSIVTIIAIILSTALICAVATMFASFMKSSANLIIKTDGLYHVYIDHADKKIYDKFIKTDTVDHVHAISFVGNESYQKGEHYEVIDYLELDDNAFKDLHIKLSEGRLPKNNQEVLITKKTKIFTGRDYKVGDTFTAELSDDSNYVDDEGIYQESEKIKKKYTVVGIVDSYGMAIGYYNNSVMMSHLDNYDGTYSLGVVYKNIRNTYKETRRLVKGTDHTTNYNYDLLRYSGVASTARTQDVIYELLLIVIGIVVACSIFVIRNSFAISIMEKKKEIGILTSVGSTKRQIRKIVIREGLYLGVIGIPLGIGCGIFASWILCWFSNAYLGEELLEELKFTLDVPWPVIAITVVGALITIILSSLGSAFKASRISPIEAIRSNDDIKIKRKKMKTSKLTKKLLGVGGVIASKNLKRSKKKYRTTVISLIVSITIFISLSYFLGTFRDAFNSEVKEISFDVAISRLDDSLTEDQTFINQFKNDKYYTEYVPLYNSFAKDVDGVLNEDGNVPIVFYEKEEYDKYLKKLKVNEEDVKKKLIYVSDNNNKELTSINLQFASDDYGETKKADVALNTDVYPFGYNQGDFMVASMDLYEELKGSFSGYIYVTTDKSLDYIEYIESLKLSNYHIEDLSNEVKMINRIITWISVFLYGFIIVITLIGITNIFNTITTNMSLRSKEFAMLKSIGMTKKEFNRMIFLESIIYGMKSFFFGSILGCALSYLIYNRFSSLDNIGIDKFELPYMPLLISFIFVMLVVGLTMKYSLSKINKQNIIETIRNDNI